MKKRFLGAFALIASSFVADQAFANTIEVPNSIPTQNTSSSNAVNPELVSVNNESGDIFNFVLKRSAETGKLMAYHESHSSHRSHSSHYSSRN
jgi:hypothetical protein